MPLSRDAMGGGTEADGSRSREYCSQCYREGEFTNPDLTAEQMMWNVRGRLMQMKLPSPVIEELVDAIPSLGRWRE
jgi:hypothetical protein